MRKIILYIATSVDGYIADIHNGVAWLQGDGSDVDNPGSYASFYNSIDTVILGYKTYHQIISELSIDKWVYQDKMSYVITSRKLDNQSNIKFSDNLLDLINELKSQEGKDIWICGGASIVNQLIDYNLVDRYHVTVIPTILGDGIPLFTRHNKAIELKLISTASYNGMVDLVYEKRGQHE